MGNLGLSIAASGINAMQTAMDTVAENLSNTNTPGYVDETANLVTNPITDALGVGAGVNVASVTQPSDELLLTNAQQSQASLAQSSALQQVLQQAQLSFQEPSSSGLSADLTTFWQSWDQVTANPTSSAARGAVVAAAQNVTSDLQQASSQLTTTSSNAVNQLNSLTTQANTLLSDMASLNEQIQSAHALGNTPNSLIDQRNQIMNQLASDIGASGAVRTDGSMQVHVGGVTLVQGNWSDTVATSPNGPPWQLTAQSSHAVLTSSSGTVAGLLAAVNQYLPAFQSQLNAVSTSLSTMVNNQLTSGYTAAGAPGVALFVGSSAAGISVNPTIVSDPTQIAAASQPPPAAANDGSNAQTIADMWNSPAGPDATYRTLVQAVGDQVSSVNNQVQAQTSVANAAQQNLQAVTGVNQNNELVKLINYQQTYQASAKVITTVDSAVQALLNAV